MKKICAYVLVACTLMQSIAWAQDNGPAGFTFQPLSVEEKQASNKVLGVIGLGTMFVGVALMIPWPKGEDWKVNGNNYCYSRYTNEINFERGACGTTEPMTKAGLVVVGVGALMTWLGYRRVTVTPQVDKSTVAMSATVKW